MRGRWLGVAALLALAALEAAAQGIATSPAALQLPQAVAAALDHYPAVIAAQRQAQAAQAAVELQRTAYAPDVRLTGQLDRASDNNTPGLLIGNGLPTISGPVAAHFNWQGANTSSGGAIFNWEAFDFGRRAAGVDFFRALATRADALSQQARLEAGAHAADVFLADLAAEQGVRVASADVARWQTVDQIVRVLVQQQLRPGADSSRADAELAAAQLGLARAQQELERQQASLAQALGQADAQIAIDGSDLLQRTPAPPPSPTVPPPLLRAQAEVAQAAGFALRQSELSDRPRFALLGSAYGRGTSILSGTRNLAVAGGVLPFSAGNWVLGLGLDYSFTRHWQAQKEQAGLRASQQAEQARLTLVQDSLTLAQRQARADLAAARQALQYAPVELAAAQTGEAQARARYTAGLSSIVDLANAEELLVKGQTDSLLSQIEIWRAQLKLNFAQGDLAPFLRAAAGH